MNKGIAKQRLLEASQLPILRLIDQYKIVVIGRIKSSLLFLRGLCRRKTVHTLGPEITLPQISPIIVAASYEKY